MKRKKFIIVLLIALLLVLVGCGSAGDESGPSIGSVIGDFGKATDGETPPDAGSIDAMIGGEGITYSPGSSDGSSDGGEQTTPEAGSLTASVYFDNNHYDFWKTLINAQGDDAIFEANYNSTAFNTLNRIKIVVPGIKNAKVTLMNADKTSALFTTYTDGDGNAFLFSPTLQDTYNINVSYTDNNGTVYSKDAELSEDGTIDLDVTSFQTNETLDLMLVLDTTGSMGDEITYLQTELDDVLSQVKTDNPNVIVRFALILYKDVNDAQNTYLMQDYDFTTDLTAQAANLELASASGGGDFPEAVDEAMAKAVTLSWSEDSSTKILLHVADAPAHDEKITAWSTAVNSLAAKGVRIITVASSGIDTNTEGYFRSQSMISNGAYVYLTDDSGIGETHEAPTLETAPVVEYLNALLVRLINGYYSGSFEAAIPYNQSYE